MAKYIKHHLVRRKQTHLRKLGILRLIDDLSGRISHSVDGEGGISSWVHDLQGLSERCLKRWAIIIELVISPVSFLLQKWVKRLDD